MDATSDDVRLKADSLSLALVPGLGGSVSAFRLGDINLMRPLSDRDRAAHDILGVAMFPMLPYANRIAGNAFTYDGNTYRFDSNNPPERYNVHGTGWTSTWRLVRHTTTEAELALDVADPSAAYLYSARQVFVLDAGGLTTKLAIRNQGPRAMPFGIGLHPWFERDADVTLEFRAQRFYLEEPDGVSGDGISLPPELDFSRARQLPAGRRNNCYGGWDGRATIRYPSRGVSMTIRCGKRFKHLMLYADPTKPFFCLEPQTNASGAFNRPGGSDDPDQGIFVLGPGAELHGKVRIDVGAIEGA